jgi:NitT/TauT family transport system ATP-binding protein
VAEVLQQVPLIAEIRRALDEPDEGRAPRQRFVKRLEKHFSKSEAERQLATALEWARYGELFDFDADAEEFFLAPRSAE